MSAVQKENKMGTMPIPKLLFTMAIPMAISMLIQALYNIVDSVYVSQINEAALTAVSLAFPIQNLIIAIVSGTAVGINAMLSRSLGSKNFRDANKTANNAMFLILAETILFILFGIFGAEFFFRSQTTDTKIIEYGTQYLSICTIVSIGITGEIILERLMNSTGKTIYTMITQGTGAIINIILDPILIFGKFGLPEMGIRGAAWATVIGQIVAMLLAFIFNMVVNKEIKFSIRDILPESRIIKIIFSVGVPSIIMMSIGSIMTYSLNRILIGFTSTAATVFGVYFKLQSFVFMPIFGINNGMVPIIAYNHGARRGDRIMKTILLSNITAFALMMVGLAAFQFFPETLLGFFNPSPKMLTIGNPALRTISLSFIFAGFCIISSSTFQALGHGVYSMLVSFARQLIVLIPAAYLLSLTGVLRNVWFSFPIAEIVAVTASFLFLVRLYKKEVAPIMPEGYNILGIKKK